MEDNIDIEKVLEPNANVLIIDDEGTARATILDVELDPVKCSFDCDGIITVNTKNLEWITLDMYNLNMLIKLRKQAIKYYKSVGF